jgi:DMSO/TMAO reductase YedYZ molybdopterin-dependent catalytic subunit
VHKRLLAFLLMVMLAACARAGFASATDWKVTVTGAVARPLTLSYSDLKAHPQSTLKDIVAPHCADGKTKNTWVGPSLADVLQEAGAAADAQQVTFTA